MNVRRQSDPSPVSERWNRLWAWLLADEEPEPDPEPSPPRESAPADRGQRAESDSAAK